jgi:predicted site-specific integrase-resolvase
MNNDKYISPSRITKQFDITSGTLRRWAEEEKIRCLRPNGTRRIYNIDDVKKILGVTEPSSSTQYNIVCYARVSSSHQKEDLERQVIALQSKYPDAKIIKDIGSGLNWNRPGFNSILEQVHNGTIQEVVVTYKDRMCRFGFELVQWIFKKSNAKLVVLGANSEIKSTSNELSEDLLAVITVFVAKNNGLRAGQYRRDRKELEKSKKGQNENPEIN